MRNNWYRTYRPTRHPSWQQIHLSAANMYMITRPYCLWQTSEFITTRGDTVNAIRKQTNCLYMLAKQKYDNIKYNNYSKYKK